MINIKETCDVRFDDVGFAVHKVCGTRVTEEWSIARTESYELKRDGTTVLADDALGDKDCQGVWCGHCDMPLTMEVER